MVGDFHFDEASHTYTLDGVRLPSVTQILKPIGPDLSQIPPAVLERKRALGVAVHLACELDDSDELDEDSLDAELRLYLEGWRAFKRSTGLVVVANERRLYHPRLRYAGTLDRMGMLTNQGDAAWMLDIKTAVHPHASYGVQTAAYCELAMASDESIAELPRRGTVHLFDDGTFKLHEYRNPNDLACFRALLSVNAWKESNQ